MSQFSCICGKVTHSDDEPRDGSGVLHSITDLQEAESRITRLLADYFGSADRRAWVRANFEFPYPDDASEREVISDIISRELDAAFTSVFRCPHCGRIGMKSSEGTDWKFFEAVRPAG
jgi:hypothetical protein